MKRVILSNDSNFSNRLFMQNWHGLGHNYVVYVNEENIEKLSMQISRSSAYDDTRYPWASVKNVTCDIILDGKFLETFTLPKYIVEDYENVDEYLDEIIDRIITKLERWTDKLELTPKIMHY